MKTHELLEAKEQLKSPTLVGQLLLILWKKKVPMKVRMQGLNRVITDFNGMRKNVSIPDQEWNITKVSIHKTALDKVEVRVHTDAPEDWFEILPEDDKILKLYEVEGEGGKYWLLTSRDGKGVKL